MGALILLAVIIMSIAFVLWKSKKRREVILESVLIGVVAGICISFSTDANYRASIKGPILKLLHTIFEKDLRYVSENWANIEAIKIREGVFEVSAANIVSGDSVTFQKVQSSELPADLRWAVLTGDEGEDRQIINIQAPTIGTAEKKSQN